MLKTAEDRRRLFEEALGEYRRLLVEVSRRQTELSTRSEALDRSFRSLNEREDAIRERERSLRTEEVRIAQLEGTLAAQARAVQIRELTGKTDPAPRAGPAPRPEAPFSSPERTASGMSLSKVVSPTTGPEGGRRDAAPDLGPTLDRALTPAFVQRGRRRYGDRAPTGTPRLDELLLGGLPPRSHVMLLGDAFVGKEVALYAFIAEGLRRNEPAIIVTAARPSQEVKKGLSMVLPELEGHEKVGRISWVDASGAGVSDAPHKFAPKDPDDTTGLLSALAEATTRTGNPSGGGRIRVGFLGLSSVLAHRTEREGFGFLQNVLGILRPYEALAMYALEAGALPDSQVEALLGRMDGAVLFRQTRDRTMMSVKGFGDVATHDWVECRATDSELVLGSFALERIR